MEPEEYVPTSAHPVDENPEDHIGMEIPDPWTDPKLDEGWLQKPTEESV